MTFHVCNGGHGCSPDVRDCACPCHAESPERVGAPCSNKGCGHGEYEHDSPTFDRASARFGVAPCAWEGCACRDFAPVRS